MPSCVTTALSHAFATRPVEAYKGCKERSLGKDEPPGLEFVQQQDRAILRLDYRGISSAELPQVLDAWLSVITAQPLRSIRAMVVPHQHFGPSAEAIKSFGERCTPHVFALAVVTIDPFHRALLWTMGAKNPKHTSVFDDEASALEWLATVGG